MASLKASQDELQQIEHINKILREQKELTDILTTDIQSKLNNHIKMLSEYAKGLKTLQLEMGNSIKNIYASAQEVRRVTGGTHELIAYATAVLKLDETLSDERVQKIIKIVK